jgi:hypothetical protein
MASTMDNLGPHLLGRKYIPDDRDFSLELLEAKRAAYSTTAVSTSWWQNLLCSWFGWGCPTPPPPPPPGPVPADAKVWSDLVVLDQGQYGTCVGNAWAGWGDSSPTEDKFTETDARAIYYEATCIDGHCDSTYQDGCSVRGGAKAMQARGRLFAYANERDVDKLIAWVNANGPGVIGSNWYTKMFYPDTNGVVTIGGVVEGGHAFAFLGERADGMLVFRNSWGTGWGDRGTFYMSRDTLYRLLSEQGDGFCAVELP